MAGVPGFWHAPPASLASSGRCSLVSADLPVQLVPPNVQTQAADPSPAFRTFVDQAVRLLEGEAATRTEDVVCRSTSPEPAFRDFVGKARTILRKTVEADLPFLGEAGNRVVRWRSEHDLVREAGILGFEDPTSRLLRWALSPTVHPESALARQRALLRLLRWPSALPTAAVEPVLQWPTPEGAYIDMVLRFPQRWVVVEAKWRSDEHEAAGTGTLQTIHYADAARAASGGSAEPIVVYLTPDGREPRGIGVAVMHAQVAYALACALDDHRAGMRDDLREAFRMVLGFFFRADAPADLTRLRDVVDRLGRVDHVDGADIDTATVAIRMLRPWARRQE